MVSADGRAKYMDGDLLDTSGSVDTHRNALGPDSAPGQAAQPSNDDDRRDTVYAGYHHLCARSRVAGLVRQS